MESHAQKNQLGISNIYGSKEKLKLIWILYLNKNARHNSTILTKINWNDFADYWKPVFHTVVFPALK